MEEYKRIEALCDYLGYKSMRAFANAIGIKVQTFYDIQAGRCKLSQRVTDAINEKFSNISLSWLLTGEGHMLKNASKAAVKESLIAPPQQDGVTIPHELVQMFGDMAATIRSQQEELASLREHHAGYMSPATKKSENVLTDVDR